MTVEEKKVTRIIPQFLVRAIEYTVLLLDGKGSIEPFFGKYNYEIGLNKLPLRCL